MSKRLLILVCSIFLVVPLMFYGCGNDGSAGSNGINGTNGTNGINGTNGTNGTNGAPGPGSASSESCVVCHGNGQFVDVATMHRINADGTRATLGSVTATINSVTFGTPSGDNVPVSVTFTMVAKSVNGTTITNNVDLTSFTGSGSTKALSYVGFAVAKLEKGQTYGAGTKDPNEWHGYVLTPGATGSGPFFTQSLANGGTITSLGGGQYTYTFPDNAVRVAGAGGGYVDNATHRVAMQIYNLPASLFMNLGYSTTFPTPFANATFDKVPAGGTVLTRDIVTTAACLNCHDPLGFHSGGARYDTKYCVVCHNPNITAGAAGWDNASMVKFIHGIHGEKNLGTAPGRSGPTSLDFSEVTYPQDIRNCDTCHAGTDGDNWKNLPSIVGCGSCHTTVNFATGLNHAGGPQANNGFCAICHNPTLITGYHADNNATPNNVPAGLDNIVYFIDNVTVDNNFPVVTFHITKNGANLTIPNDNAGKATTPPGYTGSPAFLLAYALPQDGVTTPADYNNLGRAAGQPASVNITGLTLTGTSAAYTTKLTTAFPAGATMRAVGLQSYWSQTVGGVAVGRHAIAVQKAVTGDKVRRIVVKSSGCSECHKRFEGHGGSRVQTVEVCVMCHNPSLTSSGRTIDPAIAGGINPDIVAAFGSDPLKYPEVPNNFKDMIHGIHSAYFRGAGGIEFVDIRNRLNGVLVLGNEITYPGQLRHCTKCHIGTSYRPDAIPDNVLLSTTKITTGNAAETRAQITAARTSMPNATDLVNSPITAACFGCHATDAFASHMVQNGGDINSTRAGALVAVPWDLPPSP